MLKGMYGHDVSFLSGNCKTKQFEKERGIVVGELYLPVGYEGPTVKHVEVALFPDPKLPPMEQEVGHRTTIPVHRVSGSWRTMEWPDTVLLWKHHMVKVKPFRYLDNVTVVYRKETYKATIRCHERVGPGRPLAVAEFEVDGDELETIEFQLIRSKECRLA